MGEVAEARLAEGAAGELPARRDGALPPGEPDLICDFWTEINRNLSAELEAEGWPELTLESSWRVREMMDYQVMERLRRRVDAIVEDKATAEALKPYYRFLCKRPLLERRLLPDVQPPERQADRRVGDAGRRAHDREGLRRTTASNTRSTA